MVQTSNKTTLGTRQKVTIAEEEVVPIPSATAESDNTITVGQIGGAGALNAMGFDKNELKGQLLIIFAGNTGGNLDGQIFHITGNTSKSSAVDDTLTLREYMNNEWTGVDASTIGITDLQRMGVTTMGIPADKIDITQLSDYSGCDSNTVNEMFGLIESGDLPDPEQTVTPEWVHGSDEQPNRHIGVFQEKTRSSSLPNTAVIGKYFASTWGRVYEVASHSSDSLNDNSIATDVYPGDRVVTVADNTGTPIAAGNWIQVGDNTDKDNTEIRKVNDVNSDDLYLNKPLRNYHNASDAQETVELVDDDCLEVNDDDFSETGKYVTHYVYPDHQAWSNGLAVYKSPEGVVTNGPWELYYGGVIFPELSFSASTSEELKVDMQVEPLTSVLDLTGFSIPTIDDSLFKEKSAYSKQPLQWAKSKVSLCPHIDEENEGSRTWSIFGDVDELNFSITHPSFEKHRGFTYIDKSDTKSGLRGGRNPVFATTGATEYSLDFTIPLSTKWLYNKLDNREMIDAKLEFWVDRGSSGFEESWKFIFDGIALSKHQTKLPSAGEAEVVSPEGPPKQIRLEIKDKIPYY